MVCIPIHWFKRLDRFVAKVWRMSLREGGWVILKYQSFDIQASAILVSFPYLLKSYKQHKMFDPRIILGKTDILSLHNLTVPLKAFTNHLPVRYFHGFSQIQSLEIAGAFKHLDIEFLHFLYGYIVMILQGIHPNAGTNTILICSLWLVYRMNIFIRNTTFISCVRLTLRSLWRW